MEMKLKKSGERKREGVNEREKAGRERGGDRETDG
jgi:hypothetical protein